MMLTYPPIVHSTEEETVDRKDFLKVAQKEVSERSSKMAIQMLLSASENGDGKIKNRHDHAIAVMAVLEASAKALVSVLVRPTEDDDDFVATMRDGYTMALAALAQQVSMMGAVLERGFVPEGARSVEVGDTNIYAVRLLEEATAKALDSMDQINSKEKERAAS